MERYQRKLLSLSCLSRTASANPLSWQNPGLAIIGHDQRKILIAHLCCKSSCVSLAAEMLRSCNWGEEWNLKNAKQRTRMNKENWWCHHLLYFSTTTQEQKICNKQTTSNNDKQSIQYAQLADVLLRRFVLRASIWVTYCKVPASSFGPAAWSAFYKDAEEQGRKGDNGDNAIKDSIRPDAASADMPNVGTNATECAQNATSPSSKFWWQIAKCSQLLPCPDMNQTAQPRNRCPYPGQTKTSSTRPCCPSDIATLQQLAGLQGLQAGSDDAPLSWLLLKFKSIHSTAHSVSHTLPSH